MQMRNVASVYSSCQRSFWKTGQASTSLSTSGVADQYDLQTQRQGQRRNDTQSNTQTRTQKHSHTAT
eukprot:9537805-Alexandrium_andersonii.AAC.1